MNVTNWGIDPADMNYRNFNSKHTGLANFAMADGSIKAIRYSGETLAFRYLSGIRDGVVVDTSLFFN